MTAGAAPQASLKPILAINFVGTLGFSIVLPFLVFLVTRLGGNAVIYGLMGAAYSFFQLIGAPILGRWSDRWGRKPVLILSQVGTLLSWGIFLVALALPVTTIATIEGGVLGAFTLTVPLVVLFVARALDGLTGGNVSVANAYLADITREEDRSANFGKMAVSANLGFIVGPAIAGALGATAMGETLPVAAAFAISAVATVLIVTTLERRPCGQLNRAPAGSGMGKLMGQEQRDCVTLTGPTLTTRQILALPAVGRLLGLYFLVFVAFNFFYVAFPVHAATALAWSLAETGIFFSVMSVMMAVVQGPILSRASRRFGDRALILGGSLVLAAGFAGFLSSATPVIYLAAAGIALGNGLMWPSLLGTLSNASPRETQGVVQGFAGSAGAVASIIGLIVGGLLYGGLGAGVFLLAAIITVVVFAGAFAIQSSR